MAVEESARELLDELRDEHERARETVELYYSHDAELGDLDGATVVSLTVFVASTPEFTQQHLVADGASGALTTVLGARGQSPRTAVATPVLPLDSAVEVQLVLGLVDTPA